MTKNVKEGTTGFYFKKYMTRKVVVGLEVAAIAVFGYSIGYRKGWNTAVINIGKNLSKWAEQNPKVATALNVLDSEWANGSRFEL